MFDPDDMVALKNSSKYNLEFPKGKTKEEIFLNSRYEALRAKRVMLEHAISRTRARSIRKNTFPEKKTSKELKNWSKRHLPSCYQDYVQRKVDEEEQKKNTDQISEWPSKSSDLNPIENDAEKRKKMSLFKPGSLTEFETVIYNETEQILDMDALDEIMWAEDEEFERAVKDLDLRSILGLMEALQIAMRKEQLHFEELTLQLQKYPDRNSYNHRKISAALCSTQRLLTNFCTKHMMCSGQRSLRSSFTENCSSVEDTPVVKVNTMSSGTVQNGGTNGFKESLRFFQSQVEKASVPRTNNPTLHSKKPQISDKKPQNGLCVPPKGNLRTTNQVPSVDNILSNVKTLCATRNGRVVSDASSTFPTVHQNINESKTQSDIVPLVFQTSDSQKIKGVTRSEQVSTSDSFNRMKRPSLLSSFNPIFEPEESEQQTKSIISEKTINNNSYNSHYSHTVYDSKKTVINDTNTESLTNDFQQKLNFENMNVTSCLKSINSWSNEQNSVRKTLNESVTHDAMQTTEDKVSVTVSANRTFGQCKEKLSQMELSKASLKDIQSKVQDVLNENTEIEITENGKDSDSPTPDVTKKDDDESISEKQSDSFESDYDSQDFVVHKASFPEDYLEAISEDNYSSVNEDYEVEHPEEQINPPDIPSPDYVSDEEEYHVQHEEDDAQYEDVEFIDNTAQYMNDPRRYMYYPDDKELEVIPEEDEDDIEEYEEMYSHEETYKPGGYQVSNQSSDDSRYNNHGECDSGLTDDQRSSSSTAEECELEDDTDSAKGSLPLQDSSSESPTNNERANMFKKIEYHKKKSTPRKRIIEDYEKPKVNGKNVETISLIHQNGEDEMRQARNLTSTWDPQELLKVLYRLDFPTEPLKKHTRYINKEGYLEKLPSGRKKATYWNPWKNKYIKLKDGFLYCYDNNRSDKPSMSLQLMGGHIESLESKMIGVDDQKGHYVVLRCSDEEETESWENALRSHCSEDFVNAYTSPCLHPLKISKDILVIDLGSCSVRAGILMSDPSLPQLFFPTVCGTNKLSQKKIFGMEALKPSVRKESTLSFPLHPSAKVTKYSIDVSILPDLMKHIFKELNVYPEDYKIQLSMPRNLSLQTKLKIAGMLLDDFRVKAINLTHQAILSLHAYNSKSGIIVDIGDRLDVIPIIEGYIVESGVTRLPYGGQRMIHHLKHALAEKNISVVSDVETYLARYILEQLCYVAEDFTEELQRYHTNPDDFEMSISTSHFFKEDNMWDEIILDLGRFQVPEGLFTPEKWGIDNPGLHKLVHHAIQECGVDLRREMCRSIYLSGGLTLLPGFAERLESEIDKLTPYTITPKVHASPYRYHMSYIGACQIALGDKFDEISLTKQIWKKEGNTCVKKWHI